MILTIDRLGSAGDGGALAPDGTRWHIPYTLPGERVVVDAVGKPRDGHQRGKVIAWETYSPDRVTPPCPYFGVCGSCMLQHLSDGAYQDFKIGRVRHALERLGLPVTRFLDPVFLGPGGRRRITLAAIKKNTDLKLGYNEYKSKWIRDVDTCLVVTPLMNDIGRRLRPHLMQILPDNVAVDIFIQQGDHALEMIITGPLGNRTIGKDVMAQRLAVMADDLALARIGRRDESFGPIDPLLMRGALIKTFGPLRVDLPWGAFLQPSQTGEDALVRAVQACLNPIPTGAVADLFCGTGTLSGALLEAGIQEVHSFDATPEAVTALKPALNGRAYIRNLFSHPLTPDELKGFATVLLDPPRAGASEQITQLARSQVKQVIYVSCNPATFARDAMVLRDHGWEINTLQIIDQFYGSAHIELVADLRRY